MCNASLQGLLKSFLQCILKKGKENVNKIKLIKKTNKNNKFKCISEYYISVNKAYNITFNVLYDTKDLKGEAE